MIIKYWEGALRVYHHTAPINMLYGLYQALCCVLDEGLERVFARHRAAHEQLVAGLKNLGMHMLVAPAWRLPMLNAVLIPAGVDEAAVRKKLLLEHDIEIGGGLGPLAGKIWRDGPDGPHGSAGERRAAVERTAYRDPRGKSGGLSVRRMRDDARDRIAVSRIP